MIETLLELVEVVREHKTGGYDVEFDIEPNTDKARAGDSFFLVINVQSTMPWNEIDDSINGQWWFWADGRVMQVL